MPFLSVADKLLQLLRLLPSRPREFLDRASVITQARFDTLRCAPARYEHQSAEQALREVAQVLSLDPELLTSPELQRLDQQVRLQHAQLARGFDARHNADLSLAHLCYLVCRALRPAQVVETGVAHGTTSLYILTALHENAHGMLHSIDLPPLHTEGDALVGNLVPPTLRSRWQLHFGSSRRLLPVLLAQLGCIDVFVHDSLHTEAHMRWEFQAALPHLRPGGVLIFDDIEGNAAWQKEVARGFIQHWVIPEQNKRALCGLAVK